MKSAREIQVSKRFGQAWNALSSGHPEQAFNIINEGINYEYSRELSKQLHWWQNYEYPELKNINRDIKRELALVISWNTLLGDYWKWALKESIAPLVGVDYGFNVDFHKIKDEVRYFQPSPSWSDNNQRYENWDKIPNYKFLSLHARSLFIVIMKHAQVNFGGLTDTRYLGPLDADEIKYPLQELAKHNLISIGTSNSDLLMSETVAELKKFAFENSLNIQGSKHQIIQAIISEVQEGKIKKWFDEKEKLDLILVRPLASSCPRNHCS